MTVGRLPNKMLVGHSTPRWAVEIQEAYNTLIDFMARNPIPVGDNATTEVDPTGIISALKEPYAFEVLGRRSYLLVRDGFWTVTESDGTSTRYSLNTLEEAGTYPGDPDGYAKIIPSPDSGTTSAGGGALLPDTTYLVYAQLETGGVKVDIALTLPTTPNVILLAIVKTNNASPIHFWDLQQFAGSGGGGLSSSRDQDTDQFLVKPGLTPPKITVAAGVFNAVLVSNGSADNNITWPGAISSGDPSNEYELEYGTTTRLYAEYYGGGTPAVFCVALLPGESPAGASNQLLATFVVDAKGEVISFVQEYTNPTDVGWVTTFVEDRAYEGIIISGGVWQRKIDNKTYRYYPVDGDILWGAADSTHSRAYSRVFEGEGVVWARFKDPAASSTTAAATTTSVATTTSPGTPITGDGEFQFFVLAVDEDPAWADGETWYIIATFAFEYAEDAGTSTAAATTTTRPASARTGVTIRQEHQGGLHSEGPSAKASACLTGSPSTFKTTGTGTYDFDGIDHRPNLAILYVADLTGGPAYQTTITVKSGFSGIYNLTLQCEAIIDIAVGATEAAYARALIYDGSNTLLTWELAREETAYSSKAVIEKEDSSNIPLYIDASLGDVNLTVVYNVSGTDVELYVKHFAVELSQLTTTPDSQP